MWMKVRIYSSANAESRAGNIWVKDIILGFIQAVLLMSVFWTKIEFSNVVKSRWGSQGALSSAKDS